MSPATIQLFHYWRKEGEMGICLWRKFLHKKYRFLVSFEKLVLAPCLETAIGLQYKEGNYDTCCPYNYKHLCRVCNLKSAPCLGWCGSVDWVLACEPKGHWFDSQSGHMPGLRARSLVGGTQEAINQCISAYWSFSHSLYPSLALSLKSK